MKKFPIILAVILFSFTCAYYNAFYLAQKNFEKAEENRKKSQSNPQLQATLYTDAIRRASKILEFYPKSKWVDDALLLIGKAYYHQAEFTKSERKFQELIANFPKSDLIFEAYLFLGLCQVRLNNRLEAREAFNLILDSPKSKNLRSEAILALAEMALDEKDYSSALSFYQQFLTAYKKNPKAGECQFKIAEVYENQKNYNEALKSYGQVKNYTSDGDLIYLANFKAGEISYSLKNYSQGLEIFALLLKEKRYFDREAQIKLKLAEGYNLSGQEEKAIQAYQEINTAYPKTEAAAQAFYQLGLIYQNQKEDLKTAKEFYAKAKDEKPGSEVANLALQKSADISKLEEYQKSLSSEETEESAKTRFLLAELYLTQMNKPESALAEYRSLVESDPNSEYTPKALLAMAWICHNRLGDTLGSKKICEEILEKYPNSDYAKSAKKFLNIQPEILALDMPEILYLQAESLLLIHNQIDTALSIYREIMEKYPNSGWAAKSLYALAWAKENFELAPDSEVLLAYQEVLDKYPDSKYAPIAEAKLGKKKTPAPLAPTVDTSGSPKPDSIPKDSLVANPMVDIEQLRKQFPIPPLPKIKGPIVYPITLLDQKITGRVGMKIMIDFLGAVREAVVLYTSGYPDMDKAAQDAALKTLFDPLMIAPEQYNSWFFYEVLVSPPP
ncbi:MAG: hypothetical protein RBG1_1C00001G0226 [candidate division Zixibacteria bacterium RBG-1]|nr:MAG: hypothetical protein RBG1_1C00001G0226 [candidate division Zixibacteria bacterium RBG-1]OGC83935.1 MAG: hypothetical protein A2V73_03740 [candidate division Zixibacteria bacterium RBG_19FT_COMBO_42_43]